MADLVAIDAALSLQHLEFPPETLLHTSFGHVLLLPHASLPEAFRVSFSLVPPPSIGQAVFATCPLHRHVEEK